MTIRDYSGQSFIKPHKGYETHNWKDEKMYAIVETGGKQYQVEEGRYVDVELLEGEKDAKIVFDKIVMLVNGKKSKVGQPYVAGASVEGKIMLHDRAKKVIVYKQRPKKGYRKNKVTDKVLQELWFQKSELLLKSLQQKKQLLNK